MIHCTIVCLNKTISFHSHSHQTQQVYFLLKPICKEAQLPQIHATRGALVKDVDAMYMELQLFQDVIYKN